MPPRAAPPRVVRAPTPVVRAGLGRERRRPPLRRLVGSRGGQGFVSVLSHESRNLRKSARGSLSAASCARAAHSGAFCRQLPILCPMTVPPLEPAAFSISPGSSLENKLAERHDRIS